MIIDRVDLPQLGLNGAVYIKVRGLWVPAGNERCACRNRSADRESRHESRLFDRNRNGHVRGCRPETHVAVASLISQLPGNCAVPRRSVFASFELGLNLERTGEDAQHVCAYLDFFRLRVRDRDRLERPTCPGELQRNQILILRLVAIDVETREDGDSEVLAGGPAGFHSNRRRWCNDELILLGAAKQWQPQAADGAEQTHSA